MTSESRFAEDANYWDTTVSPFKSQGEILELLEEFGAINLAVMQGQTGGKFAWMIRFEWRGKSYRFFFTPLTPKWPNKISSFGGKKRVHTEQAKNQMGRIALYFVKAILTAAEAYPAALFGFLELPSGDGGIPPVVSELDVSEIHSMLPTVDELTPRRLLPELGNGE